MGMTAHVPFAHPLAFGFRVLGKGRTLSQRVVDYALWAHANPMPILMWNHFYIFK